MGGKTVPQHVRRQCDAQSGAPPVGRKNLPDAHTAERTAATIDEEGRRVHLLPCRDELGARLTQIAIHKGEGLFADGDDTLLVALANAAYTADRTVQIHYAESDEFGDAQA